MTAERRARSSVVSRRVALAVAVGFAALVAALLDDGTVAAVGVFGAVVAGWGGSAVAAERKRRVAVGSVALAVGSALLVAGLVLAMLAGATGYAPLVVGTFVVAVATGEEFSADGVTRFKRGVSESAFLCLVALFALVVWDLFVASGVLWAVVVGVFSVAVSDPLGALWWLQIFVLAVGVLVDRAARAVALWTPDGDAASGGLVDRFRLAPGDVPRWYVGALLVQFFGANVLSGLVESFLATRPVLDRVVETVLLSGVVHAALGGVAVIMALVAFASVLQRATVFWTGTSPGYTLAYAAGGFAAIALSVSWAAFVALSAAVGGPDPTASSGSLFVTLGPAVPVLAAALGTVLATAALVLLVRALVARTRPTTGVAAGAVLLFAGTVFLAEALPAVVVAVGAGASLLVWDLGAHTLGLERDLRGVGPPMRTELVHATAVAAALVGGVVLATAVGYLFVPLPVSGEHATVALALTMLSVVAFAFAFRR
ncbi:hypothetical protein [Halosimplex salinum]|uniref:hypothetical protein n=1 Tax=Halosimplex salinum TaxID=1710538 RepID=UPI000F483044|nr:hypothetical protein [Halosimplex salinum]